MLHCTKKLATHLPSSSLNLTDPDAVSDWHANILTIQGRKCVLFIHDQTRFILFDRDLTKPDFQRLHQRFLNLLEDDLTYMGTSQTKISGLLKKHQPMHWDTQTQRSVLGSLNITRQDMSGIWEQQDLMTPNVHELHRQMNKRPMTIHGKYIFPEFAFLALFETPQT